MLEDEIVGICDEVLEMGLLIRRRQNLVLPTVTCDKSHIVCDMSAEQCPTQNGGRLLKPHPPRVLCKQGRHVQTGHTMVFYALVEQPLLLRRLREVSPC